MNSHINTPEVTPLHRIDTSNAAISNDPPTIFLYAKDLFSNTSKNVFLDTTTFSEVLYLKKVPITVSKSKTLIIS
ncbi:hypothetical protein [Tenacibaculum agarivorans]|uniref:hypothetical protein n=1 Tax=Tenacibaculum agarivorans TaxID=1908389 RepID=UPI00117C3A06|nr:hypothetical protein [Tenacibaculum agarivorans]